MLDHIEIYNIARDSFLRLMIHSLLCSMSHTSAEQKIEGKMHNFDIGLNQGPECAHIPLILRLETWNVFTRNLVMQQCRII